MSSKISSLPATSIVLPSDIYPVVTGGSNKKIAASNMLASKNILGTILADNAPSGYIGEIIAAQFTSGITATNNVAIALLTISLTAGDWMVTGNVNISTIPASWSAKIGINTAIAVPTLSPMVVGDYASSPLNSFPTRINTTATTSVYLVLLAGFTAGTFSATQGQMIATRLR